MSVRQYNVFDADYRHDAAGGYVTPEHERRRHPEYQRHQAKTRDWVAGQEAEEFVDIAGTVLALAEEIAGSYTLPAAVLRDRAAALRVAADGLADLARRMQ